MRRDIGKRMVILLTVAMVLSGVAVASETMFGFPEWVRWALCIPNGMILCKADDHLKNRFSKRRTPGRKAKYD